ncbi:hypothetical protein [Flaviaesturariibacter amylovorans]|uniref:Lipoprotein n=1 Tax=Flaviaesturariibacter amylovorans TaxID=1084520 RepID=A0ABP8HNZ1_9BACT
MYRFLFLALCIASCATVPKAARQRLPEWMTGAFTDDYGIRYTISDSLFVMNGPARYRILEWNEKEQYLLAQNDPANKTDGGLFTRIDYMPFRGMEPYLWGYCLTVFNAKDLAAARQAAAADRAAPRKGCNGYPFSRMKRVE